MSAGIPELPQTEFPVDRAPCTKKLVFGCVGEAGGAKWKWKVGVPCPAPGMSAFICLPGQGRTLQTHMVAQAGATANSLGLPAAHRLGGDAGLSAALDPAHGLKGCEDEGRGGPRAPVAARHDMLAGHLPEPTSVSTGNCLYIQMPLGCMKKLQMLRIVRQVQDQARAWTQFCQGQQWGSTDACCLPLRAGMGGLSVSCLRAR